MPKITKALILANVSPEKKKQALEDQRIRLLYLEWSGDPEVETRLEKAGYSIFDSVYVGSSSADARREFERSGFEVIETIPLSTGQAALEMAYRGSDSDIGAVLRKLNHGPRWIQTDLVALPAVDAAEFVDFLRSA